MEIASNKCFFNLKGTFKSKFIYTYKSIWTVYH